MPPLEIELAIILRNFDRLWRNERFFVTLAAQGGILRRRCGLIDVEHALIENLQFGFFDRSGCNRSTPTGVSSRGCRARSA